MIDERIQRPDRLHIAITHLLMPVDLHPDPVTSIDGDQQRGACTEHIDHIAQIIGQRVLKEHVSFCVKGRTAAIRDQKMIRDLQLPAGSL